jgi:hypothetical protein
LPPPPPPNTPFFWASTGNYNYKNDSKEEEDGKDQEEEGVPCMKSSTATGGMFGTYKEQRFQKLAKRVDAQTEAEMDKLQQNMEGKRGVPMSNFCFDVSSSDSFALLGSRWRGVWQKTTAT